MSTFDDDLRARLEKSTEEEKLQRERLPEVIHIAEHVFRPILQSLKENYLDPRAREKKKRVGKIITDNFDGTALDRMPHDGSLFEYRVYIEYSRLELFISAKGRVTVKVGDHVNIVGGNWLEKGAPTTTLTEAIQQYILRGIDFVII